VTRAEIDRFIRGHGLTVVEHEVHAMRYGIVCVRAAA
jgi:hypothetical protein